ncbi:hypothetical protein EDD11_002063 [Mortierella claussenii]|nr:hypothetical protein EDD11_002063 [Mortierella claussenii]
MDRIHDPNILKEKFYAEHQLMREQLNLAGQFGLELQQSLEHAQRAERQSYAQIQALQDENLILQSRVHHSQELSAHLTGSEDEVQQLTSENESLQKELDGCRRELKTFRKELDSLVEQMAEMGTEVMDAKTKVSVYSRRLNEVEQELNSTQELNVNLQEQLRVTLERQKQTQSSTAQVVKNMQNELGKVVSDSGTIRSTLEELESRQEKCEGRVVEMITNTKEYAQLLEEAQTTIQTLRIESDMEGRGWSPSSSSWDNQLKQSIGQLSTLAVEDSELNEGSFAAGKQDLDPHAWSRHEREESPAQGMSLGMELGLGGGEHINQEIQTMEHAISSPPSTPATYQCPELLKQLTPAPSPSPSPSPVIPSVEVQNKETQTPKPLPVQSQSPQTAPALPKDTRKFSTHALSSELQQRLEEHNILQTVFSPTTTSSTSTAGSTRPPWNPSVALENLVPNPSTSKSRSRSATRASTTNASSRSSSRSVSQASLYSTPQYPGAPSSQTGSSSSGVFRTGGRSTSMPSSQSSPSSLLDAISAHTGKRQGSVNHASNSSRPRSRTAAATVERNPVVPVASERERNPTPGLKYLLSSSAGSTDLSGNVITKTKKAAGSVSSVTSTTVKNASPRAPTTVKKSVIRGSMSNNSPTSATGSGAGQKTGGHSRNNASAALEGIGSTTPKTVPRPLPASPGRTGTQTSSGTISKKTSTSSLLKSSGDPGAGGSLTAISVTTSTTASASATGRTTPHSHPMSLSPSPLTTPSSSSTPSMSPAMEQAEQPASPSAASKKLKAMAMEMAELEGLDMNDTLSNVTSVPLPLPPVNQDVPVLVVQGAPSA